ncbi:hypothetical protein A3J98_01070 [candidate division WS6 bacterium RIFOXYC1_FULL_33_10]|uniref:DUF5667 domain-containing protein n=2 Tax=Candidatus Dojkabacteria TaxID=74243 RepID=A0A1F4UGA9_9BACT|nr:MAG: hypothetical protein A2400_00290 [candidate division WS6 bacterium RIFOXYB1_FULL_33_14]OGC44137.1 MAG: hypothetical protein A3J98_01070 [candidate division WS6 bacterium RIFOXYC1_FULL_33_10]
MRKISLSILVFGLLCVPTVVFAQEDMVIAPSPTADEEVTVPISPDSPFYFLTSVYETIDMALTFDDEAKLDKAILFADRRVAEMDIVAESGDEAKLEKLQEKYEKHIATAEKIAARNQEKEKEMIQTIVQAQSKHVLKLKDVAEKVPLKAKENIDRVIGNAQLKIDNANSDNSQSDSQGGNSDSGSGGSSDSGQAGGSDSSGSGSNGSGN